MTDYRAFKLAGPLDVRTGNGMWAIDAVGPEVARPVARCLSQADAERIVRALGVSPERSELNPRTADMVLGFAFALATKLREAEKKYGYSDGWETEDWEAKCREQLQAHIFKGDPLDVAAYAAFCWARGWRTTSSSGGEDETLRDTLIDEITMWAASADEPRMLADAVIAIIASEVPASPEATSLLVDTAWRDLLEKDDRTSPAEYPDMALITHDELAEIVFAARSTGGGDGR